ncbi:MAG: RNase adapter RapZ [Thermodesulfobacteriota bacterium]
MKHFDLIVITGLSGSGKSTAIDALEDAGYFCVDNMPLSLVPEFLRFRSGSELEVQRIALGMDLRQQDFMERFQSVFETLRKEGYSPELLFFEASEEVLLKRYSETRRQHPLSLRGSLVDGIREERRMLEALKSFADRIIDTSHFTVHELKELMIRHAHRNMPAQRMRIGLVSFGFKYGVPLESDLLVDVRFITNPYFIPELRDLDGLNEHVRDFILKWPETREFINRYGRLLEYLVPFYEKEGKSYLTVAVGCTGGRHRSVTVAAELHRLLEKSGGDVSLSHRDLELSSG